MQTKTVTVLVIDDHPLFRKGVVDSLSLSPKIKVVGQASNGDTGLSLIRELRPDVAVVDVNLPGLNGQQVAREVVESHLPTRIVLLTAYDDPSQKAQAYAAGAFAYCTKDVEADRLVEIVLQTADGRRRNENRPLGAKRPPGEDQDPPSIAHRITDPIQPLSSREMEVLVHVTRGMSNKEIAMHLGISHQTVKNHVTAVLRKLRVSDRTQAAVYALRRGWVRLHRLEH